MRSENQCERKRPRRGKRSGNWQEVCLRVDEDNGGHSNMSGIADWLPPPVWTWHGAGAPVPDGAPRPEAGLPVFGSLPPLDKDGAGFWRAAALRALRQLGCVSGLFLLCLWLWVQLQFWCRSGYIVCHEILSAKCILKPNKEETTEETNTKASK